MALNRNKTNNELKITEERILYTVKKHPEIKTIIEELFPSVFEKQKVFCKIGTVLKRDKYPDSLYALFKWNGEVRLLNITANAMWKNTIKVGELTDSENYSTITFGEFMKITNGVNDFKIVKF